MKKIIGGWHPSTQNDEKMLNRKKLTGHPKPKIACRNVNGDGWTGCKWWWTVVSGKGCLEPSMLTITKAWMGHVPPSVITNGIWKENR